MRHRYFVPMTGVVIEEDVGSHDYRFFSNFLPSYFVIQIGVSGVATRIRVGDCPGPNPGRRKRFFPSFLQDVKTGSGARPATRLVVTGFLPLM